MGKRFITFLIVFLLINVCMFGQGIRPSERVSERKDQGKAFEKISLADVLPNAERVQELSEKQADHVVLQLDNAFIDEILDDAPEQFTLSIPYTNNQILEIELVQVNPFTDDFQVTDSKDEQALEIDLGIHYRGIVKGDVRSIAALSIFEGELMGLFSSDDMGNLVLGKLDGAEYTRGEHVLYDDKNILSEMPIDCGTEDDGIGYTRDELAPTDDGRALTDCVRFYFEVDDDIVSNKGGATGATNYTTGIYNQVATLYDNENINTSVSEIFVWTTSAPYSSSSSSGMLADFQQFRNGWNGDLAQLLSYQASGGIAAGFDGICNSNEEESMSFSSINSTYNNVPTYSFTIMVVTHEFGHTFGSRHTHACVWNGNNTAIDGCAGQTEGFCSLPGYPSGGGTIMSYCHIQSVGINFNAGFGPQPGNVIRNEVSNGSCLSPCGGGGGPTCSDGIQNGDETGVDCGGSSCPPCSSTCNDNELTLTINLDNYPGETTWTVTTSGGSTVASGGSYSGAGSTVVEDICLPDGCDYSFNIFDSYGDGICCGYGNGSYTLSGPGGTIASGGNFGSSESTSFDLGSGCGGGGCLEIDFNAYTINAYGNGQDAGSSTITGGGTGIKVEDNAWKSITLNYTVTPNTVIEFDFGSTTQGEIHGIGFDSDNGISSNLTFQLFGTQNWGINNYSYTNVGYYTAFTIPVGQFYTGSFNRLFFVADHDGGARNGDSYFRNIRIHEGGGCPGALITNSGGMAIFQGNSTDVTTFNVYPNPTSNELNIDFSMTYGEPAQLKIYNMMGQVIELRQLDGDGMVNERFNTSDLPNGTYIIQIEKGDEQLMKKFNVVH